MILSQKIALITLAAASLITLGCEGDEAATENARPVVVSETGGSAPAADTVTVSGTLALGDSAAGLTAVEGKPMALATSEGEEVATTTLGADGSYSVSMTPGTLTVGLRLQPGDEEGNEEVETDSSGKGTPSQLMSLKLVSVFPADSECATIGMQQPININTADSEVNAGTQTADRVGAIKGKITLVTGESPVGIEVYVPGTIYSARTDENGEFLMAFMPNGSYKLRAEKDGFGSLQWSETEVVIRDASTVCLGEHQMALSAGPAVTAFSVCTDGEGASCNSETTTDSRAVQQTQEAFIKIHLANASRYRIGTTPDFSDYNADWKVWYAADNAAGIMKAIPLAGKQGNVELYLQAVDADGLTSEKTIFLKVVDPAVKPVVPSVYISSSNADKNDVNPINSPALTALTCNTVSHFYLTDSVTEIPTDPALFTIPCDIESPQPVTISGEEGQKGYYIWGKDSLDRISADSQTVAVTIDTTSPTVTVAPNSDISHTTASGGITTYYANQNLTLGITTDDNATVYVTRDTSTPTIRSEAVINNQMNIVQSSTVKIKAFDKAGNSSATETRVYQIDKERPDVPSLYFQGELAAAEIHYTDDATPKLHVESCDDISKIFFTEDASKVPTVSDFTTSGIDCNEDTPQQVTLPTSAAGTKTLYLWTMDTTNNINVAEDRKTATVTLVDTNPTVSVTAPDLVDLGTNESGTQVWLSHTTVTLPVATAATANVHYTLDTSDPTRNSPKAQKTDATNGTVNIAATATLKLKAFDRSGRASSSVTTAVYRIDTDAPSAPDFYVKSDATGSEDASQAGYTSATAGKIFVDDCTDIYRLYLTSDGGETPTDPDLFTLTCDKDSGVAVTGLASGTYYLWARDRAGNMSATPESATVVLDQSAPTLTVYNGAITDNIIIGGATYTGNSELDLTVVADDPNSYIYYTVDQSEPTASKAKLGPDGKLNVVLSQTLKFIAIDFAGNKSAVKEIAFSIDKSGPTIAFLDVNSNRTLFNTTTIPLKLVSTGATKYRIANIGTTEDKGLHEQILADTAWTTADFSAAVTVDYTLTSYSIGGTDVDLEDGEVYIIAEFADDVGNVLAVADPPTITYDSSAPSGTITMRQPESPTGALNQLLAWTSTITETVTYQVKVIQGEGTAITTPTQCEDASKSGSNRYMTTSSISVRIDPALDAPTDADGDTYYWCIRAVDIAGNATAWQSSTSSDTDKKFIVKILGSAFQAFREQKGDDEAIGYAKELVNVGDVSGDSIDDVAYSIISGGNSACPDCGTVKIYNVEDKTTELTITDPNQNPKSGFGHRMVMCDVDGDSEDELIVSAPEAPYTITGALSLASANDTDVKYYGAGAIYAFDVSEGTLESAYAASYANTGAAAPMYQSQKCLTYQYYSGAEYCVVYEGLAIGAVDNLATTYDDVGLHFGYDLECRAGAGAGGSDLLLVAEPGFRDGSGTGRVSELAYDSGNTFSAGVFTFTKSTVVTGGINDKFFGVDIAYSAQFATPGGCHTGSPAEVLAVGSPKSGTNGGKVEFFNYSGSWQTTPCDTFQSPGGQNFHQSNFGARVHNVGDVTGGSFDIIAASTLVDPFTAAATAGQHNVLVQFMGNDGGDGIFGALQFEDNLDTGPANYNETAQGTFGGTFGYTVVQAGDWSGDDSVDIAISSPMAKVSGKRNSGELRIYTWSTITAASAGTLPVETTKLVGNPEPEANFATAYLPLFKNGATISTDKPSFAVINRPSSKMVDLKATVADPIDLSAGDPGTSTEGEPGIDFINPDTCPFQLSDDKKTFFAVDLFYDDECTEYGPNGEWIRVAANRNSNESLYFSQCDNPWKPGTVAYFEHHYTQHGGPCWFEKSYNNNHHHPDHTAGHFDPAPTNNGTTSVSSSPNGKVQVFADVKIAPGSPYKITGANTDAKLGRSFAAVPDVDRDGINDFIVSQPGGRCSGKPYGAVSLISILDFEITHSICGYRPYDKLGFEMYYLDNIDQLMFFRHPGSSTSSDPDLGIHTVSLEKPDGGAFADDWVSPFLLNDDRYDWQNYFYDKFNDANSTINAQQDAAFYRSPVIPDGSYFITPPYTIDLGGSSSIDLFVLGEPEAKPGAIEHGAVHMFGFFEADNGGNTFTDLRELCIFEGVSEGDQFGYSASIISDLDGDTVPEVLVGSPGRNSDAGMVAIFRGTMLKDPSLCAYKPSSPPECDPGNWGTGFFPEDPKCDDYVYVPACYGDCGIPNQTACQNDFTNRYGVAPATWPKIDGSDGLNIAIDHDSDKCTAPQSVNPIFTTISPTAGELVSNDSGNIDNVTTEDGFGSFVLGLDDYDGAGGYAGFVYVANQNARVETSTGTPQNFVLGINSDGSYDVLRHETGAAGSMTGAFATEIDIGSDGKKELVIASPGGPSALGNTGNLRILSGEKLATAATSGSAVLQTIFNPDNVASNFGVYMVYEDITGDTIPDIVIGADEFDTSQYQNAGALYVFPMQPITEN